MCELRCPHAVQCFSRHWSRKQSIQVGIDPGAKTTGIAVIVDGTLVWSAQVQHRGERIRRALEQRRGARSARRCRRKRRAGREAKPARWKYRTRPAGWLPPSLWHRVQSTVRWVKWCLRFATAGGAVVSFVRVEVSGFDVAKLRDPTLEGSDYQRGPLYRANLREAVYERDGRWCLYCGSAERLEIDHVVPRSRGGSDAPHNRVAACHACNHEKDNRRLEAWLEEVEREATPRRRATLLDHHGNVLRYTAALAAGKVPLRAAAAVNVAAPRLALELAKLGPVCECTGADTAAWRNNARLPKAHWIDALCAVRREKTAASTSGRPLEISMIGRGRRLVVKRNASGFPRLKNDGRIVDSHRETPPHGLRAGDTVRGNQPSKKGQIVRGTLSTARHDGRCTVKTRAGARINCMANTLILMHRGTGAHIQ